MVSLGVGVTLLRSLTRQNNNRERVRRSTTTTELYQRMTEAKIA